MAILKYKNSEGEYVLLPIYTVNSPQVVQDTGNSTTAVMSQNAVTLVVENLPDNEDVVIYEDKLKLADRSYNPEEFSGKGYKILRRNIVEGKNILTLEMVNLPNTVYEIRYDFDLNDAEITIPEGCTLKFDGGSLSNGTMIFNNTNVLLGLDYVFKDIVIKGIYNFDTNYINVKNYGAKGDGITNDTPFIQKAIDIHKKIFLPKGTYKLETPIYIKSQNEIIGDRKLSIINNYSTVLKPTTVAITYDEEHSIYQNQDVYISNIAIMGGTNCIDLPLTHTLYIANCTFQNFTGCGVVHVRGERIYFKDLYFNINNSIDADKAISLANSNDSIYNKQLENVDFGSEGQWCDRVELSNINIVSLSNGKFNNGIYCNGGLSNCTTNNIVIMGTLNTPFYSDHIQYSIIKNFTIDNCGKDDKNAEYGFCVLNLRNSTIIGISPNNAGNCDYDATFYIGYGYNSTIIDCIATKTVNGTYGFKIGNNANRSLLFLNCGGVFYDSSTNPIFRSQLQFIGCNFTETNNNIGNSINNKNGNFIIQFNKSSNGSEEYTDPVFTLNRDVGGAVSKSFFKALKDRIVINDKFNLIYGDNNPENNINSNIGSIYIQSNGNIYVKTSNNSNTDWILSFAINNKGTFAQKPTSSQGIQQGFAYFCTDKHIAESSKNGIVIYYSGEDVWVDSFGRVVDDNYPILTKGTTEQRPTLTSTDDGFEYYDSTLKKKILWNGAEWVNLDGSLLV